MRSSLAGTAWVLALLLASPAMMVAVNSGPEQTGEWAVAWYRDITLKKP